MHQPASLRPNLLGRLGVLLVLFNSVCGTPLSELPAYPLYPNPGRQHAASEVAKLVGTSNAQMSAPIIKAVDGRVVADTSLPAFALLPGCHIVQTANNIMLANEYIAWRGSIGSATFAFAMKPGHTYIIRASLRQGIGNTAEVLYRGQEQDSTGKTTAEFDPVRNIEEINACLHPRDAVPAPASP